MIVKRFPKVHLIIVYSALVFKLKCTHSTINSLAKIPFCVASFKINWKKNVPKSNVSALSQTIFKQFFGWFGPQMRPFKPRNEFETDLTVSRLRRKLSLLTFNKTTQTIYNGICLNWAGNFPGEEFGKFDRYSVRWETLLLF